MEIALSDVGDDMDDGRFDLRALGYSGWRGIVRPAMTVESPSANEVVEGEESSSEVEESVKSEQKQHALGTLFQGHFALFPFHSFLHLRQALLPFPLTVSLRTFDSLCGSLYPSPSQTSTSPRIQTAVVDVVADIGQRVFHAPTTALTRAAPSSLHSSSNFTSAILSY